MAVSLAMLSVALPAQAADTMDAYREKTRVVAKVSDCLAAAAPDEIVVCGRKQTNLRYRLPPLLRAPSINRSGSGSVNGERFAFQQYRAEGGSGSCSAVGPNGFLGCTTHQLRDREEQNVGRNQGLIGAALTYLDPDE
jgi:hypothetical protein